MQYFRHTSLSLQTEQVHDSVGDEQQRHKVLKSLHVRQRFKSRTYTANPGQDVG